MPMQAGLAWKAALKRASLAASAVCARRRSEMSREGDFQRDVPAVRGAGQPLEARAALGQALLQVFRRHDLGRFAVLLERRRQIPRVFAHNPLRGWVAHDADRGGVDLQDPGFVVQGHAQA
jgi:hypothetical protein